MYNASMIYLSDKAIEAVKRIQVSENKPDSYLRIKVVGGGCSGLSYKMEFVDSAEENDKTLEGEGMKIAIDPKSILFLRGMKIDYTDGLNGQGFVFSNPNAKQSCGCGTSFSS
jgi:iron-sulfur cluster assembly protein